MTRTELALLTVRTHEAVERRAQTAALLVSGGLFLFLVTIMLALFLANSIRQLFAANSNLEIEVAARKEAEAAMRGSNEKLEKRVEDRTALLARTNAELQLQKTILESQGESSMDGILMVSGEGKPMFSNRRFAEMWGLESSSVKDLSLDMLYRQISKLVPDTRAMLEKIEYFSKNPQASSRFQFQLLDGRTFDRYTAPVNGGDGACYGRSWFFRDITELMANQALANQAREEADRANLAKSEFLSRMSHELRTPLNAILGFGQILERERLSERQAESVHHILNGGRHLLQLINEVLDIARVESGHLSLSIEPVALADVIPEACALVQVLARERHIHIEDDSAKLNGCHVLADRQRLKQVLINLLANGIKYNRPGGSVNVVCGFLPKGEITIAISDTGPGISAGNLAKLFAPFERLGAEQSGVEGTGLGLALSQRLVLAMGGTLEARSVLGEGSSFTIALAQAPSPLERMALSAPQPNAASLSPSPREFTVLCIEDNLSNLRLFEVLLESRAEVTLLSAMQGGLGLDLAHTHIPDLILLDLNLPDISGQEVLARLRAADRTREIPVVIISADATPLQIERLMNDGAKAYLTKPLDVGQFLAVLDDILGHAVGHAKVGAANV